MWAAFFCFLSVRPPVKKDVHTYPLTQAFVNARAQSSVKIKEQPYKESFLGVSEKKDLTEVQYDTVLKKCVSSKVLIFV